MKSFWALVLFLWGATAPAAENGKLKVLTSFLPVYCFTVNVAGDAAEVEILMSERASPHDFQFAPADVRKVNGADLVVLNGLGVEVEAKLENLLKSVGKARKIVLSAGLDKELIRGDEHEGHHHGSVNPHIWLDPLLAMHCVSNVLHGLQAADPANASAYASNAREYLARLEQLHRDLASGLTRFKGAPIVTYHDAFAYFARRYELRVAGVIEEVADVSPGPRHLAELRRTIKAQRVPVIFTEANHSLKLVRQMGKDLNVPVALLETVESGELAAAAYEKAMRSNLKTIEKELHSYAAARTP